MENQFGPCSTQTFRVLHESLGRGDSSPASLGYVSCVLCAPPVTLGAPGIAPRPYHTPCRTNAFYNLSWTHFGSQMRRLPGHSLLRGPGSGSSLRSLLRAGKGKAQVVFRCEEPQPGEGGKAEQATDAGQTTSARVRATILLRSLLSCVALNPLPTSGRGCSLSAPSSSTGACARLSLSEGEWVLPQQVPEVRKTSRKGKTQVSSAALPAGSYLLPSAAVPGMPIPVAFPRLTSQEGSGRFSSPEKLALPISSLNNPRAPTFLKLGKNNIVVAVAGSPGAPPALGHGKDIS